MNVAEKPCVSLESGSSLHFHPTTVGSKTQRTHHIRNLSRLPVQLVDQVVTGSVLAPSVDWLLSECTAALVILSAADFL